MTSTTAASDVGPGAGAPLSSIITTVRHSLTSLARGKHQAGKPEDGEPQITQLITVQPKPASPPHPPDGQASPDKDDRPEKPPPLHLLALPTELLNNILRHLNFVSILELRKTCRFFHALASPPQLRILFGRQELTSLLLQHCKTCFTHDPFRTNLLACSHEDEGWPLASQCVDCALVANDERLKIGKQVKLGTEEVVEVCRWCGRPIRNHEGVAGPADPSAGTQRDSRPFHRGNCYRSYNNSLLFFFILGWVQLTIGITGAALSWRYWRGAVMVFAPSVTSFLLLWIVMGFLFFRASRKRAYRYTLLLELAILGCWIPPVYYISMQIVKHPEREVDTAMQAALALFGLNLVFRLFNVAGNVVILCSTPDLTPRKKPNAGWFKRTIYKLMLWSVAWTYPPSVEHRLSTD
ncbi:hypothetical protein QBC41DRAFT_276079 [Cercophora samala]|uniref:F-box domain-containing protein n=1 Tax=Cercophora samala TaxID=330535 RepID=A0AA39ZDM2_9PEZI|nr:hypothetical protein QBC41DRAFT_276079 [Cercophora samala]